MPHNNFSKRVALAWVNPYNHHITKSRMANNNASCFSRNKNMTSLNATNQVKKKISTKHTYSYSTTSCVNFNTPLPLHHKE